VQVAGMPQIAVTQVNLLKSALPLIDISLHRITIISIPCSRFLKFCHCYCLFSGMFAEIDFLDGWLLGFCIAAAAQLV
jgi:hypothetical protein